MNAISAYSQYSANNWDYYMPEMDQSSIQSQSSGSSSDGGWRSSPETDVSFTNNWHASTTPYYPNAVPTMWGSSLTPGYEHYNEINQQPNIHRNHQFNQYLVENLTPQSSSASSPQDIKPAAVVPSETNNKSKRKTRFCRKKTDVEPHRQKRSDLNNRERQRTQLLNDGFQDLRKRIPSKPDDKLSKFNTIKIACQYIEFLQQSLESNVHDEKLGLNGNNKDFVSYDRIRYAFNFARMAGEMSATNSLSDSSTPSSSRG
jgi:hypothetical protein